MTTKDTADRLSVLLAPSLEALGLDLEAVEVTTVGKRRIVRVAVDQDGGVTMDDIADATRAVSQQLDEADPLGAQPYTLEVSSRGVDRPLTQPRHWRRNIGRLVKVDPHEGAAFTGRIVQADEESARIEVSGRERGIAFAQVKKAKVQVEFSKPPPKSPRGESDDSGDSDDSDDSDDSGAADAADDD